MADGDAEALYLAECGGADAPPLVLLHGFGGSRRSFSNIIARLGDSFRVLAFDLPGHAGSLVYPGKKHPKAAALAVLDALNRLSVRSFHLCGFSMGGAVACLLADKVRERVLSMTLVAPGGFGPEIASDILSDFAGARSTAAIRDALSRMSGPDGEINPQSVADLSEERTDAALTAALREICAMIASEDGRQGELPAATLEGFGFPVELVWGTEDPVLPFHQSRNGPAGANLTAIPGAGHMLLDEAPEAVAAAISKAASRARLVSR